MAADLKFPLLPFFDFNASQLTLLIGVAICLERPCAAKGGPPAPSRGPFLAR